jgi:hypothetical protein
LFEGYFFSRIASQPLLFWIHQIKISIHILLTAMEGRLKEALRIVIVEINHERFL